MSQKNLESMTVSELREKAKVKKVTNYCSMRKCDLIKALQQKIRGGSSWILPGQKKANLQTQRCDPETSDCVSIERKGPTLETYARRVEEAHKPLRL